MKTATFKVGDRISGLSCNGTIVEVDEQYGYGSLLVRWDVGTLRAAGCLEWVTPWEARPERPEWNLG